MALFFYDCTNNCRVKLVRPGEGWRDERKPRACGQIYSVIATPLYKLQVDDMIGSAISRRCFQAFGDRIAIHNPAVALQL